MRHIASSIFKEMQQTIVAGLESLEPEKKFIAETWNRPAEPGVVQFDNSPTSAARGGGGLSMVLDDAEVFERAGVNFSEVMGVLPAEMSARLVGIEKELEFYATGTSLVIHPRSPLVPTTHANYRYLEVAGQAWFGGGGDLTPYYLFEEDASHFHRVLKQVCDDHNSEYYPRFKAECDNYFYLPHRGETRGIGGIFFDYLGRDSGDCESYLPFIRSASRSFLPSYLPIVEKRKDVPYTTEQRQFQLIRRGRYVEFNLIYDRGTLFGLKTKGRSESILMSLPPEVKWNEHYQVEPNSPEEKLIGILKSRREWI